MHTDNSKIHPEPSQDAADHQTALGGGVGEEAEVELAIVKKPKETFPKNYKKSWICSRLLFHFSNSMIWAAYKRGGILKEEDLIDGTLIDDEA